MFPGKLPIISQPPSAVTAFTNTYSLEFDGTDQYVEVSDHSSLNMGTGDFSLSAWVKISAHPPSAKYYFISNGSTNTGTRSRYSFEIQTEGILILELDDNTNKIEPVSITPLTLDAWQHLVVTVDRDDSSGIKFYLNGSADGTSSPLNTTGSLDDTARPFRIGARSSSQANFVDGLIDEVAVFKNRILSASEVNDIYNSGTPTDLSEESGLVGYWRMEEGTGSSVADSSDNSNTGTLVNSPTWDTDVPS